MIILEPKPLEEVLTLAKGFESILIVGCDGCAGIYQVGGEKQAETMSTLLEMGKKLKEKINLKSEALTVLRQCDLRITATTLKPIVDKYQAILSLACGIGVQTIAQAFPEKIVIPGNDTKFIGMQDRELGKFLEFCRTCGECILFETGGICPITRCAKGLMNGPCGGMADGKCEVGDYTRDCAWFQIWEALKRQGRTELYKKFRLPRDRSFKAQPQEIK